MKKETKATPIASEKKERIPVWLYPTTIAKIESSFEGDNCKSKSEYIEKAIDFYTGYISSKNTAEFLNSTLLSAMGGTIHDSENRIARMLFKLSVETSMMMNVIAAKLSVSNIDLVNLRRECIENVKRSCGSIDLEEVVKLRQGWATDNLRK